MSHRCQNNFSQVALNCNPGNHFALYGYFIFIFFRNLQKKKKLKMAPSGIGIQTHTHVQTYRHQPELCQGR